jgi:4-hydroxy-3-polyprenylbenzoate decarboxylase
VINLKKKIIVAICGASGVIYGIRLLKALLERPVNVKLIISKAGEEVLKHETDYNGTDFKSFLNKEGIEPHPEAKLECYQPNDLFAPPASGSFRHNGMVIAPCSMKTLGMISSGIADNLIHRAADVCLKEKRPLILIPRETPLDLIHLENMHRAALAGATIMPPSPSFYFQPKTINELVDTVIARVLDHIGIRQSIVKQWGE